MFIKIGSLQVDSDKIDFDEITKGVTTPLVLHSSTEILVLIPETILSHFTEPDREYTAANEWLASMWGYNYLSIKQPLPDGWRGRYSNDSLTVTLAALTHVMERYNSLIAIHVIAWEDSNTCDFCGEKAERQLTSVGFNANTGKWGWYICETCLATQIRGSLKQKEG